MSRFQARLAAGAALLCAVASAAVAADPARDADVTHALDEWGWQPRRHRAAFLRLARTQRTRLPSDQLLALGDALLRSGAPAAAAPLYRTVLARDPEVETAGWARFALGWIALGSGDLASAREHYGAIVARGWGAVTASVLLALLDASRGDGAQAIATLDRVADAPETPPAVQLVAMLGGGYARFWTRDYGHAVMAFEAAALAQPTSRLVDDARYGAAWSAYRAGDRDRALTTLRVLARSRFVGARRRAGRDLVDLDLHALFRESLRHYDGAPPGSAADETLSLVDVDGSALARGALRLIAAERAGPQTPAPASSSAGREPTPAAVAAASAGSPAPAARSDATASSRVRWAVLGALLLGLVVLLLRRRVARG